MGIYETAQALFVYAKYASLYALFLVQYPAHKISFSLFKSLRPWYVRRAKQETCLCKHCENFKAYMEVLNSLVKARSQPRTLHTHTPHTPMREGRPNDARPGNASIWSSAPYARVSSAPALEPRAGVGLDGRAARALAMTLPLALDCSLTGWVCVYLQLFDETLNPPSTDADDAEDDDVDDSELDSWSGRADLVKLMEFCALKSKSDMVQFCLCCGAFDGAGKSACINGKCSICGFSQLWSKGLRKHVVDKDGNVLQSAPVEFQSDVKWTRIRSSKKTEPGEAKQPSYEAHTGTVVEFLDAFERDVMKKFPHHRFTIKRQKTTAGEFERNRCPGWVQSDVDFAMDGEIPPPRGRSAQQDHWSPMSFTAFIQVVSWLVSEAWVSRSSVLSVGESVTVEPAESSQPGATQPAANSFWAEIVSKPSAASEVTDPQLQEYGVRRHNAAAAAPLEWVERRYLRHRKLHTKAFIHISDDKTHDSHAAQTFMGKTFKYLEEHVLGNGPGKETFFAWHMHSDNAPSHFKSSKTMHFLTTLPAQLASWAAALPFSFRVFWEFGAPGHGKGVWDGIGAWMKRTVRQDIVDNRPPDRKTIKTESGNVLSPKEVAEHLKASFNTEEYVQSHLQKTINEVVVIYTPTAEIIRPKPDHKYAAMPGMKKTFLFMPVREGVVLQRDFACWCGACMRASAPGEGSMDASYRCVECESEGLGWRETDVSREDAAGVANERTRTREKAKELREQLKRHYERSNQPVWVGVQNRGEDDPDQYWVGRALRIEKTHTVAGRIGRVSYDAGDAEIAVEWFQRDVSGGEERRVFKAWEADEEAGDRGPEEGKVYTFNSTELRMLNVEMVLVPPVGGVPLATVRPGRGAAQKAREAIRGIVCRRQEVTALPPTQLWEITAGSERLILDWCCR